MSFAAVDDEDSSFTPLLLTPAVAVVVLLPADSPTGTVLDASAAVVILLVLSDVLIVCESFCLFLFSDAMLLGYCNCLKGSKGNSVFVVVLLSIPFFYAELPEASPFVRSFARLSELVADEELLFTPPLLLYAWFELVE